MTETVMGQPLQLALVSEVLPLSPLTLSLAACSYSLTWVHSHARPMLPEGIPES